MVVQGSKRSQPNWFGQQQHQQNNWCAACIDGENSGSENSYVDNSQMEYLQSQNQLLHHQLNEMRAQISSMQNTSQFAQAHVEQDKQCDEFPFHLVSMTHEAIPALLNGGDGLLRMDVDIYLWRVH